MHSHPYSHANAPLPGEPGLSVSLLVEFIQLETGLEDGRVSGLAVGR